MNYLAHAYLSFQQPGIVVGNMISDHVKGKKQYDYPRLVQKGIRLHRLIDQFTDFHETTQQLKSFFRPHYRLYAGAFADVVYDHFLANDPNEFISEKGLKDLASGSYQMLEASYDLLPSSFQKMFPNMKAHDWLFNYRYKWAIEKSFGGLVRRSAYLTESKIAFELFNEHYHAMQQCYADFFPSLKKYASQQLSELLNT